MPLVGDLPNAGLQGFDQPGARGLRAGADVEDHHDIGRNDVGRARRDRDPPDGRHDLALGLARERLAEQHRLGGAGERVAPQQHRHRAGVAGFAEQFDVEIGLSDDRGHDAERLIARLQHRPLLDVHLDIGGDVLAPVCGRRDIGHGFAIGGDRVARASRRRDRRVSSILRCETRPRRPTTRTALRESASPPRRRRRARRCRTAALVRRAQNARPPGCRRSRRTGRHTCRHRSRCRYASRSAGAWPAPKRPRTVPSASSDTASPASRIQRATRSAARRCSGDRNSRTSRSGSAEIAPSALTIASARAPSASMSSCEKVG